MSAMRLHVGVLRRIPLDDLRADVVGGEHGARAAGLRWRCGWRRRVSTYAVKTSGRRRSAGPAATNVMNGPPARTSTVMPPTCAGVRARSLASTVPPWPIELVGPAVVGLGEPVGLDDQRIGAAGPLRGRTSPRAGAVVRWPAPWSAERWPTRRAAAARAAARRGPHGASIGRAVPQAASFLLCCSVVSPGWESPGGPGPPVAARTTERVGR